MLESNSFRLYMLMGGVVVGALIIGMVFAFPMVEISDSATRAAYENVTGNELSADKSHLTMYEAIMFKMEADPRSNVRAY